MKMLRVLNLICAVVLVACQPARPRRAETTRVEPLPRNCPRPVHIKAFTPHVVNATGPQAEDGPFAAEDLTLSTSLASELRRSGYDRVFYSVDVCGGTPPSIGEVTQRTPLPELDRTLAERISALSAHIQPGLCTTLQLQVSGWNEACDWPVFGL